MEEKTIVVVNLLIILRRRKKIEKKTNEPEFQMLVSLFQLSNILKGPLFNYVGQTLPIIDHLPTKVG